MKWCSVIGIVLMLLTSGCRAICNRGDDYLMHENAGVRTFAYIGAVPGAVVGVPLSIIALPVTMQMIDGRIVPATTTPWLMSVFTGAYLTGFLPAQVADLSKSKGDVQ